MVGTVLGSPTTAPQMMAARNSRVNTPASNFQTRCIRIAYCSGLVWSGLVWAGLGGSGGARLGVGVGVGEVGVEGVEWWGEVYDGVGGGEMHVAMVVGGEGGGWWIVCFF